MDEPAVKLKHLNAAPPAFAGLRLPTGDSFAIWDVLKALGNLIGGNPSDEEDVPRLHRFREGARALNRARENAESYDAFLRTLDASLAVNFNSPQQSYRALDLINKTSQFNLNGKHFTAAEWESKQAWPGAFFATVQYEDRFGPLGNISVVAGHSVGSALHIESWVMSSRAFHRRIEHQALKQLFETFEAVEIAFEFIWSASNGPLQEFFATLLGRSPETAFTLTKERFEKCRPALYQRIEETTSLLAIAKNLSSPVESA